MHASNLVIFYFAFWSLIDFNYMEQSSIDIQQNISFLFHTRK